jgi:hypothetical protein
MSLKLKVLVAALCLVCLPAHALGTKLSQINNGGALNSSTDQLVAVRSGTTDELVTPPSNIVTYTGTPLSGNCTKFGTSGQILDAGAPCLSSSTAVTSVTGTTNRITSTGGTTPVIDISGSYVGQSSITTVGTLSAGAVPASLVTAGTFGTGAYTMDTSLTEPLLIGGTGTGSALSLQSTSGIGATDAINFLVGNNGATNAIKILSNGYIGINNTSAFQGLDVSANVDFGQSPATLTTVTDNCLNTVATTIDVVSTTGYASKGYLLVPNYQPLFYNTSNTEVMSYTGKTGSSFTGLTRGLFGTSAGTHCQTEPLSPYLLMVKDSGNNPKFIVSANGSVGVGNAGPFESLDIGGGERVGQVPSPETFDTDNCLGANAITTNVGSTAGYPTSGTFVLDQEAISYAFYTGNVFQGLIRGAYNTTPAQHCYALYVNSPLIDQVLLNVSDNSYNTKLSVLGTGKVGASTITPKEALDVNGNIRFGNGPSSYTTVTDNPMGTGSFWSYMDVVSSAGYPTSGVLRVDNEWMEYTSNGGGGNQFSGITRGIYGSTVASHASGAKVYVYLMEVGKGSNVPPTDVIDGLGNVGIGTYSPTTALTILGHENFSGTIPTLSSCGTSPAIATNSTDGAGEITEGSVSTGCTITFATAYTNAPFCTVTEQSGLSASYVLSTSAITITNIGALSGTKIDYECHAASS